MTTSRPLPPSQAAPAFPKRFYAAATLAPEAEGVALRLDGRPARTPARNPLVLPTEALAQAVADEWNAAEAVIDPRVMPMTRLVNATIDGVATTREAVLDEIRRYAGSDLLVYRAPEPDELATTQAAAWDPILAWARDTFGAALTVVEGVMFVDQPPAALAALGAALDRYVGRDRAAPFRLAALHVMTTLTGSPLLALAVAVGRLPEHDAWAAAHVDEDYQIALWGADEEAVLRRAHRWAEMSTAARLSRLLSA